MLRLFIPIVFAALFVGWFLYRLIVKKDLNRHLNSVFLGLFFFGVWGVIYWMMLT